MKIILVAFWTVMIFASILWYALLVFYVGAKGGYEILQMARTFSERGEEEE